MKSFYYIKGTEQLGPFTIDQLINEKIGKETLIWFEGLETWIEASKIDERHFLKTNQKVNSTSNISLSEQRL